jgi:hypothetical protein
MKYIKTPDLWDQSTFDAITKGNLKLQSGQWVYAGRKDHPSRFVGINKKSGTIYAAHWQGNGAATLRRYHVLREAVKGSI